MVRFIRHAPRPCPWCGGMNDGAADPVGHSRPKPGDGMLCWQCGSWQIWEPTGMRRPTEQEAGELAADAFCQRMLTAWRKLGSTHRRRPSH